MNITMPAPATVLLPRCALPCPGMDWWPIRISAESGDLARFARLLSPNEKQSAGQCTGARRPEFVTTHASLREILRTKLAKDRTGLVFTRKVEGKLALVGESMEFPIAHSWRLAVITTHSGGPIGADVERIRPIENLRGICAERFAAAGARQSFAPKPGGSRDFFLA